VAAEEDSAAAAAAAVLAAAAPAAAGKGGAKMFQNIHAHRFFKAREKEEIMKTIHTAEQHTSGEIRVHVESHCGPNPVSRAQEVFQNLGMANTALHDGVLIYLATKDRKFAIIGDEGIHRAVPPNFWDEAKDKMEQLFRAGKFKEGVCLGIALAGEHLAQFFPHQADDVNELPDEISEGR
jgi:uncharacterized membrane protein